MHSARFFSELKSHCGSLSSDSKKLRELVDEVPIPPATVDSVDIATLSSVVSQASSKTKELEDEVYGGGNSLTDLLTKYTTLYQSNDEMKAALLVHYSKFDAAQAAAQAAQIQSIAAKSNKGIVAKSSAVKGTKSIENSKENAENQAVIATEIKSNKKKSPTLATNYNSNNDDDDDDLAALEAEYMNSPSPSPPRRITRSASAANSAANSAIKNPKSPIAAKISRPSTPTKCSTNLISTVASVRTPLTPKTPQNVNDLSLYTKSMLFTASKTANTATNNINNTFNMSMRAAAGVGTGGISRCTEEEEEEEDDEEEGNSSQILANISCYSNTSNNAGSNNQPHPSPFTSPEQQQYQRGNVDNNNFLLMSPVGTAVQCTSASTSTGTGTTGPVVATPTVSSSVTTATTYGAGTITDTPPTPPMPCDMRFSTTTLLKSSFKPPNPNGSSIYGLNSNTSTTTAGASMASSGAPNPIFTLDDDDDDRVIAFSSPMKTSTKVLEPRRQLVLAAATATATAASTVTATAAVDDKNADITTGITAEIATTAATVTGHSNSNGNGQKEEYVVEGGEKVDDVEGWIPTITEQEWALPTTPVFLKMQISYQALNIAIRRLNGFVRESVLSHLKDESYLESFSKEEMNQIVNNQTNRGTGGGESLSSEPLNMKVIALGLVKLKRLDVSNEHGVTVYKVKRFY